MKGPEVLASNRLLVLVAVLCAAAPIAASGQGWQWPEKSENLQVLPADFSARQLRGVMFGFTRALGVRCSHCHVGEEGKPLSTYDFASDDNPKKGVARRMLEMLADINEHLGAIEPAATERVNMWCHTCHRGVARPLTLEEALMEKYRSGGTEAMLDEYGALRGRYYGRAAYDFGERTLNVLGYQLLESGDHEAAIAVFRLNVEQFPGSGNVYDSLAEGYMVAGNRDLAIVFYTKSLEVDPDNANAIDKLRELRSDREE